MDVETVAQWVAGKVALKAVQLAAWWDELMVVQWVFHLVLLLVLPLVLPLVERAGQWVAQKVA